MRIFSKIPVTISPFFWLVAAMIGFISSQSFFGTIVWIPIIFVSVLFHEYGHAIMSLLFGQKPKISLVAFGGITYPEGAKLPLWKEFFVVLNGPFFGFLLFFIAELLAKISLFQKPILSPALEILKSVNLYWTIANLLPILPLDGGQLFRILLEALFGAKGITWNFLSSVIIATGLSLFFFFIGSFIPGSIFFLFAYQNFESWRQIKNLTESDRKEESKKQLLQAEKLVQAGEKEKAKVLLEQIRISNKSGVIYQIATNSLARLYFEEGNISLVYTLLQPLKANLDPDSKQFLQEAAFENKDWKLAEELSQECFQELPSKELAIRASIAAAQLQEVKAAIGWLDAAKREGLENCVEVAQDKRFDIIREYPDFQEFLKKL